MFSVLAAATSAGAGKSRHDNDGDWSPVIETMGSLQPHNSDQQQQHQQQQERKRKNNKNAGVFRGGDTGEFFNNDDGEDGGEDEDLNFKNKTQSGIEHTSLFDYDPMSDF